MKKTLIIALLSTSLYVNAHTIGHLKLKQSTDTLAVSFNTTVSNEIAGEYLDELIKHKAFSTKLKNKELFIHDGIIYALGERSSSTMNKLKLGVFLTNKLLSESESGLLGKTIKSKQKKADSYQRRRKLLGKVFSKKTLLVTAPAVIIAALSVVLYKRKK